MFGTTVPDPYRWLEDAKSPEVQAWMKSQDDFTRARLAKLPGRDEIAHRMQELIYVDSKTTPQRKGGRLFFGMRGARQEKLAVVCQRGDKDHIVIDANAWPEDQHAALHDWFVSWDGKKIAYQVSLNNADEATMHVVDVDTGKVSDIDVLPGVQFSDASWNAASDGFYYRRSPTDSKLTSSEQSAQAELCFHKLGDDPKHDKVVHDKTGDPQLILDGYLSRNGRWLFADISHGSRSNDLYVRDMRPGAPADWKPIVVGKDALFQIRTLGDRFFVSTNDGAPHWHMFEVDPKKMDRASWREIVPERSDATLQGFSIVGGRLSLGYEKDVVTHLEMHGLDGALVSEISLPAIGSASVLAGDQESDEAYYSFTSYTYPTEIYRTSVKNGKPTLWYRRPVPVDSSKYAVEQRFFSSKDGTRVPMFVVRAKDWTRASGPVPLLLTGYGGFDVSIDPTFDVSIFPWLERGGAYAVVNLRGGGEYGETWHKSGMLHQKQNVFDDFIAAAEDLIHAGYTSKDKLVVQGGSNGGLLMGAVTTQRPDLFRVVICEVPLLDMIRYPKFGLAQFWVSEYGTPDSADDFRALFAYSPYHHVVKGTAYPSILMMSADSDDRVDPMHARKFTAELQARTAGGPVLLRIERNAGHGGNDARRSWVDAIADQYAFALAETNKQGSAL
jgi:prolyl oligopeptidase